MKEAGGHDGPVAPNGGHSKWSADNEVGALHHLCVNARCGARNGNGDDHAPLLHRVLSGDKAIHEWGTTGAWTAYS